MKNVLIITLLLSSLLIEPVCSYGRDVTGKEQAELENAWTKFLAAVSAHAMITIKSLSAERIRCLSCLENTEKEAEEMAENQLSDPDWYDKLYREKIYIPINTFCTEDYPVIFTPDFINKLRVRKPTYTVENVNDETIYDVIIATLKPGELSAGDEGVLHLFQFKKSKTGYKFWGLDTIP